MASGLAAMAGRRPACWFSTAVVLALAVPARAQNATDDAGANTAGSEGAEVPPATGADFPKQLTPQQRLPENLQGWMRERNRLHPVSVQRVAPPPVPGGAAEAAEAPEENTRKAIVAEYQRRLRSFDENGVTVLSNRHPERPPQPAVAHAPAPAAPAAAAIRPAPAEPEPTPEKVETRSLRTNQIQPRHPVSEPGLGWSALAAAVAALGLGWVWLRRRRSAD